MANEKTGVLQFQLSDGTYVAGYPKTILSQVIGGQDAIDQAKSDAVTEALEKAGVKTYAAGTAYHANALVADGSNLYLVLKDFTASTVDADTTSANMSLVNAAGSISTSDADAFMTVAEVDALFDTTSSSSSGASS